MAQSAQRVDDDIRAFWEARACGERYAAGDLLRDQLQTQLRVRYELEPYIPAFLDAESGTGRDVLEIGVGMGADHLLWARARPRRLVGIDLTSRAARLTSSRLALEGCAPRIAVADARSLPFPNDSFDVVYSWGVLHHTPDPPEAVREVHRVLKPGGMARIMLYHRRSYVGLMLWLRYALFAGRPFTSLNELFATRFESVGTKAFTIPEVREMFTDFAKISVTRHLSFVDLLRGHVGQQHPGWALDLARRLWPRAIVRRLGTSAGFYLLIAAHKTAI